jgi:hypothetical protein
LQLFFYLCSALGSSKAFGAPTFFSMHYLSLFRTATFARFVRSIGSGASNYVYRLPEHDRPRLPSWVQYSPQNAPDYQISPDFLCSQHCRIHLALYPRFAISSTFALPPLFKIHSLSLSDRGKFPCFGGTSIGSSTSVRSPPLLGTGGEAKFPEPFPVLSVFGRRG